MEAALPAEDELLAAAGPVQVLDPLPLVKPLLAQGTAALSASILDAIGAQVESTTAELAFFQQASFVVISEYDKTAASMKALTDFYHELSEERSALAPHLKLITDLEEAVSRLEASVIQLDSQATQIEMACADAQQ